MSVVNCKVAYIRPKYNNLKEWMSDPENVYIGRKEVVFIDGQRFPKLESNFANPYKIDKDGTRDEVLTKYRKYIISKLMSSSTLTKELLSMKGKCLGCWCHPDPCHGNILLEIIDLLSKVDKTDYNVEFP